MKHRKILVEVIIVSNQEAVDQRLPPCRHWLKKTNL